MQIIIFYKACPAAGDCKLFHDPAEGICKTHPRRVGVLTMISKRPAPPSGDNKLFHTPPTGARKLFHDRPAG